MHGYSSGARPRGAHSAGRHARGQRQRPARVIAAVVLLLVGAGVAGAGWLLSSPGSAPPTGPAAGPAALAVGANPDGPDSVARSVATVRKAGQAPPPMAFSVPVRISVPAIRVNAAVISLGENADGTVAVPSLKTPQLTSWFDDGPAPGQSGPAAMFGHVATAGSGPAVFYRLGALVPGDAVAVTRADGSVARFTVYRVAEYAKDAFPTMAVYGDTSRPELRLVTCGGAFDAATGGYLDNIVVYARLSG